MRLLKTEEFFYVGGGDGGDVIGWDGSGDYVVAGLWRDIAIGVGGNLIYDRLKDIYTNSHHCPGTQCCPGPGCTAPSSSSNSNSNSGYGSVPGGTGVPGASGNNPSAYTAGGGGDGGE
jgi:hypothetical protein